jgi:hypothetical protein
MPDLHVSTDDDHLHWDADLIEKLLSRNNIYTRADLAIAINKPYSTVCRSIAADWSGRVSTTAVLTAMCRVFDVPLSRLVREPRETCPREEVGPDQGG